MTATWRIIEGDCRDRLAELPAGSVHTCVTSPPYFGLRDYGTGEWEGGDNACDHKGAARQSAASTLAGNGHGPGRLSPSLQAQTTPVRECRCGARRVDRQIGLEPTPDEFVAALVGVFREVRRVLRDDGTVWLNLGDSYNNRAVNRPSSHQAGLGFESDHLGTSWRDHAANGRARMSISDGDLKEKDLLGVPWMVAFALRADGWYLRSEIIWAKRNCMPESVTDRPTRAHEQIFLLSKRPRYFYDHDVIREESDPEQAAHDQRYARVYDGPGTDPANGQPGNVNNGGIHSRAATDGKANKRSVWRVASTPFRGAHYATFPAKLIEPCILAGCPERACGECGAPWTRIVEKKATGKIRQRATGGLGTEIRRAPLGLEPVGGTFQEGMTYTTVGWEPSCGHDAPTVPGTLLDPFAGSGTTGMVALRHGRSFVGIELSPENVRLARDRIIDDAPLLNAHAESVIA